MKPVYKLFLLFIVCVLSNQRGITQNYKTFSIDKVRFNLLEEIPLKDQLLDTSFYYGEVFFRSGSITEAYLNYNYYSNSLMFLNNENVLYELRGLADISYIKYYKRVFVPINSSEVAEVIEVFSDSSKLLLNRKTSFSDTSQNLGPYGTTSATSSVTKINHWQNRGSHHLLEDKTSIDLKVQERFYFKKKDAIYSLKRLRDLRRIFPTKYTEIKSFVKTNNLNFRDEEEVKKILYFCCEL